MNKARSIDLPWSVSADEMPKIFSNEETNPSDNFWAKPNDLIRLIDEAGILASWDFNSALGDTIMEKYESLYVKLVEIQQFLSYKGAKGYFWIATSKEIASIFMTATAGFQPSYNINESFMSVVNVGKINARWQIFSCNDIPAGKLLMGVNNQEEESCHYASLSIINFII